MRRYEGGSRFLGGSEGENTLGDTFDAQKALFGDVRPWNNRTAWDLESEYLDRLKASRSNRDAALFDLLGYLDSLPAKLQLLAGKAESLESLVSDTREMRVCWKAQNGNSHSTVYLLAVNKESGKVTERSLGNVLTSAEAQAELKSLIGRNRALSYTRLLSDYLDVRSTISIFTEAVGLEIPFAPIRGEHPINQWCKSAAPIWEAFLLATQQNIDRYLDLDVEANELAFEFNHDRQPVRYRSIIMRPPITERDLMGPGFPEFRVVTNLVRGQSKKRQTMHIVEYKRKLSLKQLARELEISMARQPTKEEVRDAKKATTVRNRPFTPWVTEDLIAHCHLGKHTTKIIRLQTRLQARYEEWVAHRERLFALLSIRGKI